MWLENILPRGQTHRSTAWGSRYELNAASKASPAGPPPTVTISYISGVGAAAEAKRLLLAVEFKAWRHRPQTKRALLMDNFKDICTNISNRFGCLNAVTALPSWVAGKLMGQVLGYDRWWMSDIEYQLGLVFFHAIPNSEISPAVWLRAVWGPSMRYPRLVKTSIRSRRQGPST